jgi:histidinol-phosphate aminotransferase
MSTIAEKGGGTFQAIKLLLCEDPLPPIDEAIAAAQAEVPFSNFYTEPYSAPLRRLISERIGVPERLIPEIARRYRETRLYPERNFAFDLRKLAIPKGTT